MARFGWVAGSVVASLFLVACGPGETDACTASSECDAGEVCVDGQCRAPSEAGGRDGGASADVSVDAPDAFSTHDAFTVDVTAIDAPCGVAETMAVAERNPIDIIVMVDGSPSTNMIPANVQTVVQANLQPILESEAIDYRIILLATCDFDLTGIPAGRYFRFPLGLGSGDEGAFAVPLRNYATRISAYACSMPRDTPGWSAHLRTDARKVFLHFTDSQGDGQMIDGYTGTFDTVLTSLDAAQFGTNEDRHFTYHAFIGVAERPSSEAPISLYCPDEPPVTTACTGTGVGSPRPGPGFQGVATRTDGYRVAVCDFADYDEAFTAIAEKTVAYALACDFELPATPPTVTLNYDAIAVRFTSGGGTMTDYRQVADLAACTSTSFYLDRSGASPRVRLCPDACGSIRAGSCRAGRTDNGGTISVRFACDPAVL